MELLTLNSTFQPVRLVENYESLIWTERYVASGDFELTSTDIEKTMQILPLESCVTIRESTVPMIVEAHKINKPKGKAVSVTVTGRSFETILERRASVITLSPQGGANPSARAPWSVNADKQSDAAYKAIRVVIGDPVARGALPILAPAISVNDAFRRIAPAWSSVTAYSARDLVTYSGSIWEASTSSLNVTPGGGATQWGYVMAESSLAANAEIVNLPLPSDYSAGLTNPYDIKAGNLYGVVAELLEVSHRGIKSVRPSTPSKMSVDLQIYNGADLRATVVFDVKFDQFDDATYLLSYQGSTNMAYVYGGGTSIATRGGTSVRKNTAGSEVAGLNRRVLLVDEGSDATLSTDAIRTSRGLVELYKNNATALFDGQISDQVGARYNKPISEGGYGLGDIVKLNGEYGVTRDVRVAEFIRSEDATGSKAFPAFQVVE